MTRERHVRFCESAGVRSPRATHPVMAFEDRVSGERVLAVLGRRLERFGLTLHPAKTRFVDFRFNRPQGLDPAMGTTFDFLGCTHVWGKSRRGKDVVRQITAKDRYARALAAVTEWCRKDLHRPFREQHAHLSRMIRGHCAYYGLTGNSKRLRWHHHQVVRIWRKWLARRGRHSKLSWSRFAAMLLRPGDLVIMDNLRSHKGKAIRQAIRAAGAKLIFLPKYSPDLNPIEQAFAKLKHLLRKAAARTIETLTAAVGELLGAFTAEECDNYFANSGYART